MKICAACAQESNGGRRASKKSPEKMSACSWQKIHLACGNGNGWEQAMGWERASWDAACHSQAVAEYLCAVWHGSQESRHTCLSHMNKCPCSVFLGSRAVNPTLSVAELADY